MLAVRMMMPSGAMWIMMVSGVAAIVVVAVASVFLTMMVTVMRRNGMPAGAHMVRTVDRHEPVPFEVTSTNRGVTWVSATTAADRAVPVVATGGVVMVVLVAGMASGRVVVVTGVV